MLSACVPCFTRTRALPRYARAGCLRLITASTRGWEPVTDWVPERGAQQQGVSNIQSRPTSLWLRGGVESGSRAPTDRWWASRDGSSWLLFFFSIVSRPRFALFRWPSEVRLSAAKAHESMQGTSRLCVGTTPAGQTSCQDCTLHAKLDGMHEWAGRDCVTS